MAPHTNDDVGSSDGSSKPEETHAASTSSMQEDPMSIPSSSQSKIPSPPPLDGLSSKKRRKRLSNLCYAPIQTLDFWDMIFLKCSSMNPHSVKLITTSDQQTVAAHKCVLSIASPVFEELLQKGVTTINITLAPHGALKIFIRLIYSSRYEKEEMKKYALDVLRLTHFYDVPVLEQFCVKYLDTCWLNPENVLNALQVARECDLPRLSFICFRGIFKRFEIIKSSKEWTDMSEDNHDLQEEILQAINFWEKQELHKSVGYYRYLQLHEANEALVHIYMHGCSIIVSQEKLRKGKHVICGFPECEETKVLIRHFCFCETKVSGGCTPCRCVWKLLQLHSRICDAPLTCDVPLCGYFREKVRQHWMKNEIKWKLLAIKVKQVKSKSNPLID